MSWSGLRSAAAIVVLLAALWAVAGARDTRAEVVGSPLALALVTGSDRPELLAQRGIDRSWGPSEDSIYVEVEVPHWREEWKALALSGAVPGAGQAYVGAWVPAALYAAAEATGWILSATWRNRGHELQDEAAVYAGDPAIPASRWSADRWALATGSNPSDALSLYGADPDVFYDRLAHDPALLEGWADNPEATREPFTELRDNGDDRLRYARYAVGALCLNHVVSAVDAMLRARSHNARLTPPLKVRLRTQPGEEPSFAAAIERSF